MDQHEAETDCKTCEVACALLLVGGAEHYEDEEECGDDFNEDCSAGTVCICNAVGAEASGIAHCTGCAGSADDSEEDSCADNTADELADPVTTGILPGHSLAEDDAEGDGRVDVAAGDASDGVGHCDDSKTEGGSGSEDAGGLTASDKDCGAAAEKGQNHCLILITLVIQNVIF